MAHHIVHHLLLPAAQHVLQSTAKVVLKRGAKKLMRHIQERLKQGENVDEEAHLLQVTWKIKSGSYTGTAIKGIGPHGHGILIFPSGARYSGEFIAGKCDGYGVFEYANGSRYDGQFRDDKCDGTGIWVDAAELERRGTGWKYEGSWRDGKKNGEGCMTGPNGYSYYGSFRAGLKDGNGAETWTDGSTYSGSFSNNARNGHGTLNYKSSDMYTGAFKDGWPCGEGKFVGSSLTFSGSFEKGKLEGKGSITNTSGDFVYQGEFLHFKKHGKGKEILSNGDTYEGAYTDGLWDGEGTYIYANGDSFTGKFSKGKRVDGVFTAVTGGSSGLGRSGVAPDIAPSFVFSEMPAVIPVCQNAITDAPEMEHDATLDEIDDDVILEDLPHDVKMLTRLSVFEHDFDSHAAAAVGVELSVLEAYADSGHISRIQVPSPPDGCDGTELYLSTRLYRLSPAIHRQLVCESELHDQLVVYTLEWCENLRDRSLLYRLYAFDIHRSVVEQCITHLYRSVDWGVDEEDIVQTLSSEVDSYRRQLCVVLACLGQVILLRYSYMDVQQWCDTATCTMSFDETEGDGPTAACLALLTTVLAHNDQPRGVAVGECAVRIASSNLDETLAQCCVALALSECNDDRLDDLIDLCKKCSVPTMHELIAIKLNRTARTLKEISHLESVLNGSKDPVQLTRARIALCVACKLAGRRDDVDMHLAASRELIQQTCDTMNGIRTVIVEASVYQSAQRFSNAERLLLEVIAKLRGQSALIEFHATVTLSLIYARMKKPGDKRIDCRERLWLICQQLDTYYRHKMELEIIGQLVFSGDHVEAMSRVVSLGKTDGLRPALAYAATLTQALLHVSMKQDKKAITMVKEALLDAETRCHYSIMTHMLLALAGAYFASNDFDTAILYLDKCEKLAMTINDKTSMYKACMKLGIILDRRRDLVGSIKALERSLEAAVETRSGLAEVTVLRVLAANVWRNKEYSRAIEYYRTALSILEGKEDDIDDEIIIPGAKGSILKALGTIHHTVGEISMALDALQRAVSAYRMEENHEETARVYMALGRVYVSQENASRAIAMYQLAASVCNNDKELADIYLQIALSMESDHRNLPSIRAQFVKAQEYAEKTDQGTLADLAKKGLSRVDAKSKHTASPYRIRPRPRTPSHTRSTTPRRALSADVRPARALSDLQRPVWQKDEDMPCCNGCGKSFWLFRRRHHCRVCGLIFWYIHTYLHTHLHQ